MLGEQANALLRQSPDLVALQEVRASTLPRWARTLAGAGLESHLDSSPFATRRLFNLTASRWNLTELPAVGAPQPERVLSAVSESPFGQVEIHNAHVPPAPGNGMAKVETFASNHPEVAERWDAAERSLLTGLAEWDLADVFRSLNGYDRGDVSWVMHTRSVRKAAHRLDHILASADLRPVYCDYQHGWREAGLSDHSAIEAIFDPA